MFLASLAHHLHNALLPDSGFTGEMLLGPALEPAFAEATRQALAELDPPLRRAVEKARAILPDAETAFTLFTPQGTGSGTGLLARIRPGEDVVTAIETLCARHGIADARLHGVGSIDHIRFTDGSRMDCHATELRLDKARLAQGRAHVPIEVVDIAGTIMRGTLERGLNPVGVTLELIVDIEGTEE